MPEQPEIHWLWYYGVVFGLILLVGICGAIVERARNRNAEKFTPTHRRTYRKV